MWPKELDMQESHELHLELGSYKRKGYSLFSFFTFLAPKYMLLQWSVRGAWKAPLEFSWLLKLIMTATLLVSTNFRCVRSQISLLRVSAGYTTTSLRFLNFKF